mmetsp:Transcript_152133/g.283456  ORF Transcript_152133/g.283456 Transcript_152133/m.283456 type:complete len:271 (-) Transcript_152133:61-873(-)
MSRIFLVLACLACAGNTRRVQNKTEAFQGLDLSRPADTKISASNATQKASNMKDAARNVSTIAASLLSGKPEAAFNPPSGGVRVTVRAPTNAAPRPVAATQHVAAATSQTINPTREALPAPVSHQALPGVAPRPSQARSADVRAQQFPDREEDMTMLDWEEGMAQLELYVMASGTLDMPKNYKTPNGFPLWVWCNEQYRLWSLGKGKSVLSGSQRYKLAEIGLIPKEPQKAAFIDTWFFIWSMIIVIPCTLVCGQVKLEQDGYIFSPKFF